MLKKNSIKQAFIILGWLFLTVLVAGGTALLVAYGQGYMYDFASGRFIRTGLVIIQSSPGGAMVTVDGRALTKKTEYRQSFESGRRTFELTKDGYLAWKKTLKIIEGEVTMAQYPILMPVSPKITAMDTQNKVITQSASKDRQHLAYVTAGEGAGVFKIGTGGSKAERIYSAPKPVEGAPAESVENVMWSDDASRLLVTSRSSAGVTYRVIDSSGGNELDLTAQFKLDFASARFAYGNASRLYLIVDGGLRRVDLNEKTVSGVLADKVTQFLPVEGHLLFVQADAAGGKSLWSLESGDKKISVISALPPSESYAMSLVSWRSKDELAIVPSSTRAGLLYAGVFGDTPEMRTVTNGVDRVSFSPDGHLIAYYSADKITMYDLEQSEYVEDNTMYSFDDVKDLRELTWFDSFHVLRTQGGRVLWSEYDGANVHDLGAAYGNFSAYATADSRSVVEFLSNGGKMKLQRVELKKLF